MGLLISIILIGNFLVLTSSAQDLALPSGPTPSGAGQTPSGATNSPSNVPPAVTGTATSTAGTSLGKPKSITDTEYLSVKIDANGKPLDVDVKEWYRVRSEKGGSIAVNDPGVMTDVRGLSGIRPRVGSSNMAMNVGVTKAAGFKDIYISGKPKRAEGGTFQTADGPRGLPLSVKIRYFTGEPGNDEASTEVNAREFSRHVGPFKLVITVKNETKRTQELHYNDIQTKKDATGIGEVSTPFSVRIPDLVLPDADYDGLRTNGVVARRGDATSIGWTLYLAPPDYPSEQNAIVQGRMRHAAIPKIDVIGQPIYPEPVAEALSSSEQQFQKGRRSFYFDVFNLFRESLIALGGLFSVLDDSFSNLALPLIGPEKGNRDSGSFTHANLLWGVWTIAKGTEQLSRAMNDLSYTVQLARDGLKGQIATFQLLRAFLGKSTDSPVLAAQTGGVPCVPGPIAIPGTPICSPAQTEAQVNTILSESMWANIKDLEITLGAPTSAAAAGGPNDPRPYLPEAPASLATNGALLITILKIKMAILEHNFYCLQYEDHTNDCSTILGITNKPGATGWDKFQFVKFPFGQLEVDKGLRSIETEGTNQVEAALGNKIAPNSFVWGAKTIVEGVESLVDSFHQLGATWRYVADSIQNFGIFGVETSRSILQLDVNAIDLQTAARAAAARRALESATFLGKPKGSQGQLVLAFSTDPEKVEKTSAKTKAMIGVALFALLSVGLLFARFKFYWL